MMDQTENTETQNQPSMPDEETFSGIETQAVHVAGIWSRLLAFLIDSFIVSALYFLLIRPLLAQTAADGITILFFSLTAFVSLLAGYTYFVLMTKYFSQTIGKMIFGIKVLRKDGARLDWGTVIFREAVGKYISQLLGLHLGYIWAIFHPQKQTWHDLIADTYVVVEDEVQARRYVHIPIHETGKQLAAKTE